MAKSTKSKPTSSPEKGKGKATPSLEKNGKETSLVPADKPSPKFHPAFAPPEPVPPSLSDLHKIHQIDKALYQRMLAYIRMGASQHQAAAAIGINLKKFLYWLDCGRKEEQAREEEAELLAANKHRISNGKRVVKGAKLEKETLEAYYRFYHDVKAATAFAVIRAEIDVHERSPLQWLAVQAKSQRVQREQGDRVIEETLPGWDDADKQRLVVEQTGSIQVDHGVTFHSEQKSLEFSGDQLTRMLQTCEQIGLVRLTDAGAKAVKALPLSGEETEEDSEDSIDVESTEADD